MSERTIRRALAHGPLTNRQLQDIVCDHCGAVARDCSTLIKRGVVKRIDGRSGRGRGKEATYAIVA